MTYEAIAAQVGLTRTEVFNISQRFAARGAAGLKNGLRGSASYGMHTSHYRCGEILRLQESQVPTVT